MKRQRRRTTPPKRACLTKASQALGPNRLLAVLLILLLGVPGLSAPAPETRYQATGTATLANITPLEAKRRARLEAFAEIINHAIGVQVDQQTLLVNRQLASYTLLQTPTARVAQADCVYRTRTTPGAGEILQMEAQCNGKVQRYGSAAPQIQARLHRSAAAGHCQAKAAAAEQPAPLFTTAAYTPFCLELAAAEAVQVAVFNLFDDTDGQTRISRLYPLPSAAKPAQTVAADGPIMLEPPLQSAPLPGQTEALEAILVVASRRPALLAKLAADAGNNLQTATGQAEPMQAFDRRLQRLGGDLLSETALVTLPVRIVR